MWFIDNINYYLGIMQTWFSTNGNNISGIPYVGDALSSPFLSMSTYIADIKSYVSTASSWADGLYSSASQVLSAIDSGLRSEYQVLTASSAWFFNQIVSSAEAYWSILTATGYTIFQKIQGYCTSAWSILSDTRYTLWSYIQGQLLSAYAILGWTAYTIFQNISSFCTSTWAILADTRATLWSWISTANLPGWVQTWFSGQSTAVVAFIEAQIGYLLTKTFTFLGNNWTSFTGNFTWLQDQLIALMTAQAAHFATGLWGLLEQVLDAIDLPEI
jgi:hypothetical protein